MDERLVEELSAKAHVSAEMREFLKHPSYKVIERWIDAKVEQGHKDWMKCEDSKKREELWYKAQPYQEFQQFLKKTILEGDFAVQALQRAADSK